MITLLLALATAWADPCDDAGDGMPIGPVTAPVRDGGMATPRRWCPRDELAVAIDGRATIDLANFYGYLTGGLDLAGSVSLGAFEVFGHLETVRVDLVIESLTSSQIGLGHLQLGVGWVGRPGGDVVVGTRLRTFLPTATGLYRNARPLGFDASVGTTWAPLRGLRLHDEVGGVVQFVLGRGGAVTRTGGFLNLGLEARPHRVFGFVLDLDAGFGLTAAVDHVDVGVGLRFSDGRRFGFELGGRVPVAGRAPELARVGLRFSARFGGLQDGVVLGRREPPLAPPPG